MQILDVQTYEGMSFADYLALPGFSYSGITRDGAAPIVETEKMKFGTLVDCYLFEPEKYTGEQYRLVKPCAKAVKDKLGALLTHGKRQLVVTCKLVYNGIELDYKGRVDLFAGGIVVDMKVSELEIVKAINFFGYDKQVSGYALPLGAKVAVIVSVHPKKCTVSTAPIAVSADWWQRKVLEYGKPFVARGEAAFSSH